MGCLFARGLGGLAYGIGQKSPEVAAGAATGAVMEAEGCLGREARWYRSGAGLGLTVGFACRHGGC